MKVGDYVRYDNGEIEKIHKLYENKNNPLFPYTINCVSRLGKPVKSSPNIIDLIEVGDYVNGTIVTKVVLDEIECKYIELDYTYNKIGIREKDIKSIVTKEQFEAMQYKVGEE